MILLILDTMFKVNICSMCASVQVVHVNRVHVRHESGDREPADDVVDGYGMNAYWQP